MKQQIRNVSTGEVCEHWPVDVREILSAQPGEWEVVTGTVPGRLSDGPGAAAMASPAAPEAGAQVGTQPGEFSLDLGAADAEEAEAPKRGKKAKE